jgi:hypothetical protein
MRLLIPWKYAKAISIPSTPSRTDYTRVTLTFLETCLGVEEYKGVGSGVKNEDKEPKEGMRFQN